MAGKRKGDAALWTPTAEEGELYVKTLKAGMIVFDPEKLSANHRAILHALDHDLHGLVPRIRVFPFPMYAHYVFWSPILHVFMSVRFVAS
jgi:hypothetical protein